MLGESAGKCVGGALQDTIAPHLAPNARLVSCGHSAHILTPTPLAFGADLVVHVTLPGEKSPFAMPGVVRWSKAGEGMGIQFGLLGARETHAITELTKEA